MTQTEIKPRLTWADDLKALAIILVIIGHCIQSLDDNFDNNIIFRYIYAFHMPLFMFISGFFSYKEVVLFIQIKKRFFQLIIPFFCWMVVICLIEYQFSFGMVWNMFKHPDIGLWFLWALFFISLIMWGCNILSRQIKVPPELIVLSVALSLNLLLYVTNFKFFGYQFISWYFIFYSFGFFMNKYIKIIDNYWKLLFFLSLIIYVIGAYFFMLKEAPVFYKWINLGGLFIYVYKITVALSGILVFYFMFSKFVKNESKLLVYVGANTLGIYSIHPRILYFIKDFSFVNNFSINIIITILVLFSLSLLLVWLFSKFKLTSSLFLGK